MGEVISLIYCSHPFLVLLLVPIILPHPYFAKKITLYFIWFSPTQTSFWPNSWKGNVEKKIGRNILWFWQIKKHNWFTTDGPVLSPVVPIYYWQSANNNQLKQQHANVKWQDLRNTSCNIREMHFGNMRFIMHVVSCGSVCDGTQNVKQYRYRDFSPIPNLNDTGSETFFRY